MEDHASEHPSYRAETTTPFKEKAILERLDMRGDRLIIRTAELQQDHQNCQSAMCKHDVMHCETKKHLDHAQTLSHGINALLASDNQAAKVMCELVWEALEDLGTPDLITTADMLKEAVSVKKHTDKITQNNKQHNLTIALQCFIAGNYAEATEYVYLSGIQLPAGYERKMHLPEKVLRPSKLSPALQRLQ